MASSNLADLLARVEAAEGPDRELDTAIAIALRIGAEGYPKYPLGSFRAGYVQADMGRDGWSVGWHVPVLSLSLDAALALVERVLPGWRWMVRRVYPEDDGRPLHVAYVAAEDDGSPTVVTAPTPAMALLAALLSALIAQAASPTGDSDKGPGKPPETQPGDL